MEDMEFTELRIKLVPASLEHTTTVSLIAIVPI